MQSRSQPDKSETSLEIILSSACEEQESLRALIGEQIVELLAELDSGQQVIIQPSTANRVGLEIFSIRDNDVVRHRIVRRRETGRNNGLMYMVEKELGLGLVFVVEESLALNSILMAMANKKNQNVVLNLGCTLNQWDRTSIITKRKESQFDESVLKDIPIYRKVQSYLKSNEDNGQLTRKGGKNRGEVDKSHFRSSPFENLKNLVIKIHSQSVTPEQWAISINITVQILKAIQYQSMNSLERLEVIISDFQNFQKYLESSPKLNAKLEELQSILRRIVRSKEVIEEQDIEGYFPVLSTLAFNPSLFMKYQWTVEIESKTEEESQKPLQAPIYKLTLSQMTRQINTVAYLMDFIKAIFAHFPKLTNLILQMGPGQQFGLFNELTNELHKYCPLLESLHIMDNKDKVDHQPGLRNILQFYPFLSDLNIKLWPKTEENGTQSPQFIKEWKYINEIQFRRVHIQRLINMIKILEKKGYNQFQCMEIIEFMKPLKCPNV